MWAHRTRGNESGLWLTPRASDYKGAVNPAVAMGSVNRTGGPTNLPEQAVLVNAQMWRTPRRMIPTPTASDHIERESSSSEAVNPLTGKSVSLDRFVRFWPTEEDQKSGIPQMWPTPTTQEIEHPNAALSEDGRRQSQDGKTSHSLNLADTVKMWPTPTASDSKTHRNDTIRFQSLDVAARNQKIAEEAGGSLNPQWVEWLMGYPSGWTDLEE